MRGAAAASAQHRSAAPTSPATSGGGACRSIGSRARRASPSSSSVIRLSRSALTPAPPRPRSPFGASVIALDKRDFTVPAGTASASAISASLRSRSHRYASTRRSLAPGGSSRAPRPRHPRERAPDPRAAGPTDRPLPADVSPQHQRFAAAGRADLVLSLRSPRSDRSIGLNGAPGGTEASRTTLHERLLDHVVDVDTRRDETGNARGERLMARHGSPKRARRRRGRGRRSTSSCEEARSVGCVTISSSYTASGASVPAPFARGRGGRRYPGCRPRSTRSWTPPPRAP